MLLVLDNFEHLMEGVGYVGDILQEAPRVKVLATSRERLGLQAEWVLPLEGLPGPEKPGLEAARASSAVKLFVERASRVQPGFALTPEVAPAVVRVAQLTQGWPLGLELAAAWVQAFDPQTIAQEIAQNLDFLEAPERDRPERHHSMRAVFDHSWRLLTAEEQAVLRRLAVFRGGFERAAAGQVAQASPRVLLALIHKSLVRRNPSGRFELLEVIRQYALEKLEAERAESEAAHARHTAFYQDLAQTAEPHLHGPEQARWLERLATEHDNLRSALAWALGRQEAENALRLATALHWFWYVRGYSLEGRDWLERALSLADERIAPELRAKALDALAEKHKDLGNYTQALRYQEEALALWQALGERSRVAGAWHTLGLIARDQGNYEQALAHFEQSLALKRELGDALGMGATLNDIGVLHSYAGRTSEAVPYFEQSLALKRQVGDQLGVAYALGNLSNVFAALGQKEKAQRLLEESLALKRELGDQQGIAVSLYNLALAALEDGEFAQAEPCMREGFQIFHTLGRRWHLAFMLTLFIDYTLRLERYQRTARLIGALYGLSAALGLEEPPGNPSLLANQIEKAHQALGDEAYAQALAEGQAMSLEQIVAYALGDTP
jgi:predicted ATPase/Tfp pilus assembly protein PilF